MTRPNSSPVRMVLLVVAAFGVGIGGVFAGTQLRQVWSGRSPAIAETRPPRSLLRKGDPFPDVDVVTGSGASQRLSDLIGGHPATVLFLDLECAPCEELATRWQAAIDGGTDVRVIGVSYHTRDVIDEFSAVQELSFPIVLDAEKAFLRDYQVSRFPLQVRVDETGTIVEASYGTDGPENDPRVAALGD